MAGTGRYRDSAHDEPVGPGTLVVVHPGHPHWSGADPGGWDELFVVFDGAVFELARRRGALSPGRPLVHGLPVARWRHRLAAFVERARPTDVQGRDAEAVDLLSALLEAETAGRAAATAHARRDDDNSDGSSTRWGAWDPTSARPSTCAPWRPRPACRTRPGELGPSGTRVAEAHRPGPWPAPAPTCRH